MAAMKVLRFFAYALAWMVAVLSAAWACGALYFDLPAFGTWAVILFVLALLGALVFVRRTLAKLVIVFGTVALVALWWLTLKPSNDRPWQPDVAETAWAEIHGDDVTVHNVRNCVYRTETDFKPQWETRTVRLSQITGMDLAIMYWGSPWMAHPIVSFRFADALPLCFSIETRKTIGQHYSAVRGLYRQYTLIYIVADERDSILVRSKISSRRRRLSLPHAGLTGASAREVSGIHQYDQHAPGSSMLVQRCHK